MDVHLTAKGLNINFLGAQDLKTSKKYEYFPDENLIHGNAIVNRFFSPFQGGIDLLTGVRLSKGFLCRMKGGFRRFIA
jgi:hypothetical protein